MKKNIVNNLSTSTNLNTSVDRLFGLLIEDFFHDNVLNPEVEYEEMEDKYQLRIAVPGFNKKNLQLRLENKVLYLSTKDQVTEQEAELQGMHKRRI